MLYEYYAKHEQDLDFLQEAQDRRLLHQTSGERPAGCRKAASPKQLPCQGFPEKPSCQG